MKIKRFLRGFVYELKTSKKLSPTSSLNNQSNLDFQDKLFAVLSSPSVTGDSKEKKN
jgi:hypothetical protein